MISVKGYVEEALKKEEFVISGDARNIVFSFKIESEKPYLFFAFIFDPDDRLRVQFQGRKNYESVFLGETTGSLGSCPGRIKKGRWKIYFTNFGLAERSEDRKIPFEVKIEFPERVNTQEFTNIKGEIFTDCTQKRFVLVNKFKSRKVYSIQNKWYRGDFHTHTKLSDGHMTPEEAVRYCESEEIDFMFLTEHNLFHTGFYPLRKLFIPAVEVTLLKGHLLVYGLRNTFDIFSNPVEKFDDDYIKNVIGIAKEQGAVLNIAHPTMVPWHWQFDNIELNDIDLIEIVNCPNWYTSESDNKKAIELLDFLWNEGYKIIGVGGSDNHLKPYESYEGYTGPSLYADPSTYVFSEELSERAIITQALRGRVYVSRGVKLDINIVGSTGEYLPGDEIEERHFKYNVYIEGLKDKAEVFLVKNGNVEESVKVEGDSGISFTVFWDNKEYNWARIGINGSDGNFIAFVNPVYRGSKKPGIKKWGDIPVKFK